jgi:hypothetical protein
MVARRRLYRGGITLEALAWALCAILAIVCFEQIAHYLNQTKLIYESVDESRKRRVRIEKLSP